MLRKYAQNRNDGIVFVHLSQPEIWFEDVDYRMGQLDNLGCQDLLTWRPSSNPICQNTQKWMRWRLQVCSNTHQGQHLSAAQTGAQREVPLEVSERTSQDSPNYSKFLHRRVDLAENSPQNVLIPRRLVPLPAARLRSAFKTNGNKRQREPIHPIYAP